MHDSPLIKSSLTIKSLPPYANSPTLSSSHLSVHLPSLIFILVFIFIFTSIWGQTLFISVSSSWLRASCISWWGTGWIRIGLAQFFILGKKVDCFWSVARFSVFSGLILGGFSCLILGLFLCFTTVVLFSRPWFNCLTWNGIILVFFVQAVSFSSFD